MDNDFVFACNQQNQWKLVYLMIALECGSPIVDSLFYLSLGRHRWVGKSRPDLSIKLANWCLETLTKTYNCSCLPSPPNGFFVIPPDGRAIQGWVSDMKDAFVWDYETLLKLTRVDQVLSVGIRSDQMHVYRTGYHTPGGVFIGDGQFGSILDELLASFFQ